MILLGKFFGGVLTRQKYDIRTNLLRVWINGIEIRKSEFDMMFSILKCLRELPEHDYVDLRFGLNKLLIAANQNKLNELLYFDYDMGICNNWDWACTCRHKMANRGLSYIFTEALAAFWPKSRYKGQMVAYPVPYISSCDRWEGKQLELRISLMEHMLDWMRRVREGQLDDLIYKGHSR